MDKLFYQDFLMDFPYNNEEFPITDIKYIEDISYIQELGAEYNIFDYPKGYIRYVNFQKLHDILIQNEWIKIFNSIFLLDGIVILDDIKVVNKEVINMKNFYLNIYYWNLSQYNNNIYVYIPK